MNQHSQETRAAIETCNECHSTCYGMLMTHCLESDGVHVRPQHVRLMQDCVEICRVTADAMLRKSQFHHQLCALCADVCEACAADCDKLAGMADCAQTCRECAAACRAMAAPKMPPGASLNVSGGGSER
jgi:hypothetical protein